MVTVVFPGDERDKESFDVMSWHVAPNGYFACTASQTVLGYSEIVSHGKPDASD